MSFQTCMTDFPSLEHKMRNFEKCAGRSFPCNYKFNFKFKKKHYIVTIKVQIWKKVIFWSYHVIALTDKLDICILLLYHLTNEKLWLWVVKITGTNFHPITPKNIVKVFLRCISGNYTSRGFFFFFQLSFGQFHLRNQLI